jgi:hypothetical protein
LYREVNDPASHFSAHHLDHVGEIAYIVTAIVTPGALINHEPRGVQFHGGIGDHELNRLPIG